MQVVHSDIVTFINVWGKWINKHMFEQTRWESVCMWKNERWKQNETVRNNEEENASDCTDEEKERTKKM